MIARLYCNRVCILVSQWSSRLLGSQVLCPPPPSAAWQGSTAWTLWRRSRGPTPALSRPILACSCMAPQGQGSLAWRSSSSRVCILGGRGQMLWPSWGNRPTPSHSLHSSVLICSVHSLGSTNRQGRQLGINPINT